MRLNLTRIILILGLLLILASFLPYARESAKYAQIPAGASETVIAQVKQEKGLDRPLALQYGAFLLLFLPGVILLSAYGTYGLRKSAAPIGTLARVILWLVQFTNVFMAMFDLMQAPRSDGLFTLFWWMMIIIAALGLGNFVFALALWNGQKWGIYGLGLSSGAMLILNIFAGEPFLYALCGFSIVPLLFWLIWPVIWQME
jgi:hypothetical protein